MSVVFNPGNLSQSDKYRLIKDLSISAKETKYNKNPKTMVLFKYEDELNSNADKNLLVPLAYAYQKSLTIKDDEVKERKMKFTGTLNLRQKMIKQEVFDILNETKSIILAFYTGFGKTISAIYFATKINYPTCIIVNRLSLIDQWKSSIRKVCSKAKVQVITSKNKIDKDIDFYIINISTVSKRKMTDFKYIKLLICDEAHTICSENYSKALFYFKPVYSIALTATPERDDGLDVILEHYFGPSIVSKSLWYPCNIYYVQTGFVPTMEQGTNGLDWNKALESQAKCGFRNSMIVKIAKYFKHRTFIIMCKRIEQCKEIYNELSDIKGVEIYTGNKTEYDDKCRILISTFSKTGVGFDFPKADSLIIGSDVKAQVLQYYGRIFRRDDVVPSVFDLRDKSFVMDKHWRIRESIYKEHGGIIKDFNKCFPEFFNFWKIQSSKIVFDD